ncbi:MAG: electron transfer flavoprotein subunit alpha/FixB family protein [Syntrophorhabdaceae bacterium]|nr:electron transfer flavoprotein subunit alpha/FixB family protein [Syntrophorhabdaceae bacterium]
MTRDVLVFIECRDSMPRKASLELLSVGRDMASKFSSTLLAVMLGSGLKEAADVVSRYADKTILVDNGSFADYGWDIYGSALEEILRKYEPMIVLGTSSVTGKDLFPRMAARLQAAMVSDAVGVDLGGEGVKIKKPLFGGKVISWLAPSSDSTVIVTFRPNSFAVADAGQRGDIIEEGAAGTRNPAMKTLSSGKTGSVKVDLQEADFIICGGRGMKSAEHFAVLDEIADLMGGRTGASRTVIDSKWREYDDQIGKSGKTVSPKLYIGCGLSGALHHIMGMDTSKVIVAINKDPNAPIFQYADYGIVDDLFAILPPLRDQLKKTREEM